MAVTNVIFQYCDGNVLDAKDYLHFATQSNGNECKVFTNGKEIDGYWKNPGELGTPARYYDENDQEIVLDVYKRQSWDSPAALISPTVWDFTTTIITVRCMIWR